MSKQGRPWFQFHTADWRSDIKLRRASFEQQGVWIGVLCVLHESPEYGIVRWPLIELAKTVGCKVPLLESILKLDILRGTDSGQIASEIFVPTHGKKQGPPVSIIHDLNGPIWYSIRMVRDEYKRQVRASTPFGDAPKPPFGDAPKHINCVALGSTSRARSDSDSGSSLLNLNQTPVKKRKVTAKLGTEEPDSFLRELGGEW